MSGRRAILVMATTAMVAVATLTAAAPAGSSTTPVRVIPISSDPVTRLPVVRHVTPAYNRYSIVNRCFLVHSASEVDHMDVKTGNNALSLHDPGENTRIYNLGGFVTPIAGASPQSFVAQWHSSLKIRNPRFYNGAGFGYGADMNGLAEQSQPTSGHPISYPFTSYDGRVRFDREQWGGSASSTSTTTAWPTTACTPTGSRSSRRSPGARS